MTPNPTPPPPPPPSEKSSTGTIVAVILAAVVIAAAVWWFLLRKPEVAPPPPAPVEAPDASVAPAPASVPVAERDARAREQLAGLSKEPEWKTWLEQQDLIGKLTAAVANVAEGESPRGSLGFLAPSGAFQVATKKGKSTIDEKSFARYDTVTRVFASLDAGLAAKAYTALHPLIDGVYAEIAPPGAKFDVTFGKAIDRLVAVPVPSGAIEVVPKGALYAFADEGLEQRSAAEKHLLRMGALNQRKVQAKLAELKAALSLP